MTPRRGTQHFAAPKLTLPRSSEQRRPTASAPAATHMIGAALSTVLMCACATAVVGGHMHTAHRKLPWQQRVGVLVPRVPFVQGAD